MFIFMSVELEVGSVVVQIISLIFCFGGVVTVSRNLQNGGVCWSRERAFLPNVLDSLIQIYSDGQCEDVARYSNKAFQ